MMFLTGYCIDLMNKLAEMIGFNYSVYYVKDDMFGSKDVHTRQWNGLVKELIDRVRENAEKHSRTHARTLYA